MASRPDAHGRARGCHYDAIPTIDPNASRPAEVWFAQISQGDTPETSVAAKQAETWIADWLTRMHAAFGPQVAA